ncbi:hypothetical protein D3C78_1304950 [compost metagenome]
MPVSWNKGCGVAGAVVTGPLGKSRCAALIAGKLLVSGSRGTMGSLGWTKSKQDVRSPQTARCQGLIASTVMPKRFSRNMPMEVWSKTCELTQPPLLQGDTTYIGTRELRPQGRVLPLTVSAAVRYLRAGSEK